MSVSLFNSCYVPLIYFFDTSGKRGREEEIRGDCWQGRAREEEEEGQGREQATGVRERPDSRADHWSHQRPWGALLPDQVEGERRGGPGTSQGGKHEDPADRDQVLRGEAQLVRHQGRRRLGDVRFIRFHQICV